MKSAFNALYGFNDGSQAQTIVVDIMWGVSGINKTERSGSKTDFYNATQYGTAIWDDSFDMSDP